MRHIFVALLVCAILGSPVSCISRWFTASFNDLKFTLHRYGHCYSGLQPVTSSRFNETEFLVDQIRNFLDQGHYSREQLSNVSALMDTICITEQTYPVSVHVDIASFTNSANPAAKAVRCNAIDLAMDSMYHVFKRAAMNSSETLDFSSIVFYPNATDRSAYYNLTDLINTSWITSEAILESVCSITNSTKEYVQAKLNATGADRRETTTSRNPVLELLDLLIEPLLGLQKRLYWESTNRLEFYQTRISNGIQSVRSGISHGVSSTLSVVTGRRPSGSGRLSSNVTESRQGSTTTTTTTTTTRPPRVNSTVTKSSVRSDGVTTLPNSTSARSTVNLEGASTLSNMIAGSVTTPTTPLPTAAARPSGPTVRTAPVSTIVV